MVLEVVLVVLEVVRQLLLLQLLLLQLLLLQLRVLLKLPSPLGGRPTDPILCAMRAFMCYHIVAPFRIGLGVVWGGLSWFLYGCRGS